MSYAFIASNTRQIGSSVFLFLAILLSACSDVGDSSNYQVGGASQGTPLNLTGVVTTLAGSGAVGLADGTGATAQFYSPSAVANDGTNLYVTDIHYNTVRQIVIATGVVTTLAGSPGVTGSADGTGAMAEFNYPQGVATDGTYVYVADTFNFTVRQITIATGVVTTLAGSPGVAGSADGTGAEAQFHGPFGITTDGTDLYVTDGGNNTVRRIVISTGMVTTLAGSPGVAGSADGTGAMAEFTDIRGITSDGIKLYVADIKNHSVRQIVIATGVVTTLPVSGAIGLVERQYDSPSDAIFDLTRPSPYYSPFDITTDGTNLYVTETNKQIVSQIVIATGVITTLAGSPGMTGSADGYRGAAEFTYPGGISTDGTYLYVADTESHTVRKIVIDTGLVTTLAGNAHMSASIDATGLAAQFNYPGGITSDGTNLYVVDTSNLTVRQVVIATGVVTSLAGSPGVVGSADGTGADARFFYPQGITTDGINLYVTDTGNNTVRQIVIDTGVVTTLAGRVGVFGSTDGVRATAEFSRPFDITTDGTNLYVTGNSNHTVRQIVIASGVVTTLAGTAYISGSADGIGAMAEFRQPIGITTDGTNLYVADTSNHIVRQIVIATGVVTTLAGTAGLRGSADGIGATAQFGFPWGITTDGTNLYLTDSGDQNVRQIVIASGVVTTLAGTTGVFGSVDGAGVDAKFNHPGGITTDGTHLFVVDTLNNTVRQID